MTTYADRELSTSDAQPVFFFDFAQGATHWRHTTQDAGAAVSFDPGSGAQNYTPADIQADEIEFSREDSSGSVEITTNREFPVALLFVGGPPDAPVTVTVYGIHRGVAEVVTSFTGRVVSARFEGDSARLTASSAEPGMLRRLPRGHWQRLCNNVLFGPGCGLTATDFDVSAPLATFYDTTQLNLYFLASDLGATAAATGYLTGGWVQLASGARRFIVNSEAGYVISGNTHTKVVLQRPFRSGTLSVSDTVTLFPGCPRTADACNTKFSNLANFRGFPDIPEINITDSPAVP